jgi:hypothetical protein
MPLPDQVGSGWFAGPTCRKIRKTKISTGKELEMLAALCIGFMLAIWVVVIWGASYFNQNVN